MPTATVTSKGQITIPKAVRDELGITEGDRVAFRVLEDGSVVVEPETVEILDLKGVLKPKRKGITLSDMDEAVRNQKGRG